MECLELTKGILYECSIHGGGRNVSKRDHWSKNLADAEFVDGGGEPVSRIGSFGLELTSNLRHVNHQFTD